MSSMAIVGLPFLSERDPAVRAEGYLDPLGLYAMADALAVKLVPGVRERQNNPRFLTAMAVGHCVCEEWDDDVVAADRLSPPWQVFEWYVVEGLVRKLTDEAALRGLPGRDKARTAIRDGVPLSAARYLKSPSVFGFHGVFRLLAHELGLEIGGRLGEFGFELASLWADEQGLPGFVGTAEGVGKAWRRRLRDAVADGLGKGATARSAGWQGWQFIAEHLSPHDVGDREARVIRDALAGPSNGFRAEVLEFLVSKQGRRQWQETPESERDFHHALRGVSADPLRALLDTILAYERLARLFQDAFDACLHAMSQGATRVRLAALARLPAVRAAWNEVPALFPEVLERSEPYGIAQRLHDGLAEPSQRGGLQEWTERLLAHHQRVQRGKPPAGRAPWVERLDDGSYLVRARYRRAESPGGGRQYVHRYRTRPLWSFARELRCTA